MDTLQVKLSMDEELAKAWNLINFEYKTLNKSGIIRLAINDLAKKTSDKLYNSLLDYFEELDKNSGGMTEDEFAVWWNKNKHSLNE
ncbi:hypothetical protein CO051_01495 [Candidatus Roizmanbacteria bacterium CG_4_9_14_0_2_um_filter_39_13]|uniref:Antitoxin n=2 Tax=Candidatus Roizmaniibacteriota TaxID=1752723 RepID=A0A2M8F2A8_9BACT|nr:MAG: hypothetical protein COY15_05730 [Candidatus Roizmanbacteria bacterium CG_4_10_14_0_2_um_filter_39_12]PJC33421.1 MAG: hypothetical protein CO051_01495 [Candidatus Roizmanbacteria bacterium CG_4_9_14_0_2_um_filter_39_13]PJE62242.1 MAG: hypothetical protein COU87_00385 [Candidatus Roizmanbacteria bacterium CG10_big_fil_rev_8_21_14_0_10_39_12]